MGPSVKQGSTLEDCIQRRHRERVRVALCWFFISLNCCKVGTGTWQEGRWALSHGLFPEAQDITCSHPSGPHSNPCTLEDGSPSSSPQVSSRKDRVHSRNTESVMTSRLICTPASTLCRVPSLLPLPTPSPLQ